MNARVTPMRQQYLDIKKEYPNCLLFFRLGDFYETFDEDAEIVARELDIVLTGRSVSKEQRIPMAGVPYHAVDNYVARLIEKGYHVAICEQMSEPDGRGLVERAITRVITPGTVIEPSLLNDDQPSYLMAILPIGDPTKGQWNRAGIAYVDITTGEYCATQLEGENTPVLVLEELARLQPREVLLPEQWSQRASFPKGIHLTVIADWKFEEDTAHDLLLTHFGTRSLESFGLGDMPAAIGAAGAVLQYIRETHRENLSQLVSIRPYSTAQFMVLDPFTRRNLELTETIRSRKTDGSLLSILDRTVTSIGARLLRSWVNQPQLDLKRLDARLDAVEALTQNELARNEIRAMLKQVADLERLTNRVVIGKALPRDLLALRTSLETVPQIARRVAAIPALASLHDRLDPCADVVEMITRAITDDASNNSSAIGVIKQGYAQELDDVLQSTAQARDWIANLEPQERRRTGIASLKVGFNKVFGYYIEVSHANIEKIPDDYIRKQTLVNAERYITPELKEYETLVLNAEVEILAVERKLYETLCQQIAALAPRILRTASVIAHTDVFLSLAEVAVREAYCRPKLSDTDVLMIRAGRHPVVEKSLEKDGRYVPNDTHFDTMSRVHIITGPNMAGKSTYIRQVAIITLMAQIGSFVPADEAQIGLVDRIFARIGAQDEIHAGQSTFMVEMIETARLLNGSTKRSLLILDEVGRGTSTYDGLAIARAVIEFIHNNPRLNCRTLFATHYHELIALPNILPRCRNFNVAVSERGDQVVFLHKVVPGGADQSYGVHVAQLAGMPRPVVERARQLLQQLEKQGGDFEIRPEKASKGKAEAAGQLPMFTQEPRILSVLRRINVDELSPIEAMTRLYELKRMLDV
jgi:DNA mismatch repair protein MutS